jgi:hypothetical protein
LVSYLSELTKASNGKRTKEEKWQAQYPFRGGLR